MYIRNSNIDTNGYDIYLTQYTVTVYSAVKYYNYITKKNPSDLPLSFYTQPLSFFDIGHSSSKVESQENQDAWSNTFKEQRLQAGENISPAIGSAENIKELTTRKFWDVLN